MRNSDFIKAEIFHKKKRLWWNCAHGKWKTMTVSPCEWVSVMHHGMLQGLRYVKRPREIQSGQGTVPVWENKKMRRDNSQKVFWQLEWTERLMLTQNKVKSFISDKGIKEKSLGFGMPKLLYFNSKCSNHGCTKLLVPPFTHSTFLYHFCRKQIWSDQPLLQHGNLVSLF